MPGLNSSYMGLDIKSPIIIASCGLTNSVEDIIEMERNGAGAVILKSLFEEEIIVDLQHQVHAMKSENYLYPETMEYYEKEPDSDTLSDYLKLISDCKKAVNIPIIASVNCVTPHNWTYFATYLKSAGADALELNISLLPTDDDRSIAEIEQVYLDVIKEVKKHVDLPISVKIGPYFTNLATMVTRLSISGIKSVTLFNKQYAADIDINNLAVIGATRFSSPNDYHLTLRWCAILSNRINCEISASPGVHDGATAIKMLLAGAHTVQIASTLYKNGFYTIRAMNDEIRSWMFKHHYTSLSEFRGKLCLEDTVDPSAYYRIQFMKHYSEK